MNNNNFLKQNGNVSSNNKSNSDNIGTLAIKDAFSDSCFQLFVNYCTDNDIIYLDELISFDFNKLMDVPNIGKVKIQRIISYYNELTNNALNKSDIYNKPLLIELHNSIKDINLESILILGLNTKSIKALSNKQINTIDDLASKSINDIQNIIDDIKISTLNRLKEYFNSTIIELLENIYKKLSEEKSFIFLYKRAKGYTLQEIANKKNMTRQRAQQIIKRYFSILTPYISALIKHLFTYDKYIKFDLINNMYSNIQFNEITFYMLMQDTNLEYLDFMQAFVKARTDSYTNEELLEQISTSFIGDGIDIYNNIHKLEIILENNGFSYIDLNTFISLAHKYGYKSYGNYITRGKNSYGYLCERLIAKHFPNGIKLYSKPDLDILRQMVNEQYKDIILPSNDRSLAFRLSSYLVLCDRGYYISSDHVKLDKTLLDSIKDYIDSIPKTKIYYAELFGRFKTELYNNTNIDNYNYLHGVIMHYYPFDFTYSKDYLQKKNSDHTSDRLSHRIKEYILCQNRPLKNSDIFSEFNGISKTMLIRAIYEDDDLFLWNYNEYSCIELIDIDDNTKDILKNILINITDKNLGYCSEGMLFEAAKAKLSNFLLNNSIQLSINLFYIISVIFKDEYNFRRPHIGKKGILDNLSTKNVVKHMFKESDLLSYTEYNTLTKKLKWSSVTSTLVFYSVEKDYLRISDNMYISKDKCKISNKVICDIENTLIKHMEDDILPVSKFTAFDLLPNINIEWNHYLLHSIINNMGLNLKLIQTRSTDRRYERGIIVSISSGLDSYTDVVIHLLKRNEINKISESSLLSFLINKGVAHKVLSKDILTSNKFESIDKQIILKV